MRLLKYPIHLVWMIQACIHVYNMKTCLFQYKTIGSEHMFTSLILLYLAEAHSPHKLLGFQVSMWAGDQILRLTLGIPLVSVNLPYFHHNPMKRF